MPIIEGKKLKKAKRKKTKSKKTKSKKKKRSIMVTIETTRIMETITEIELMKIQLGYQIRMAT